MAKILSRYDMQVNTETDQMYLDLILNSDNKKVIRGIVWDDDISNPTRVPGALVQFYIAGKNYKDDPFDIQPVGYVIADSSGEFLAGPFEASTQIIAKVFKFWRYNKENYSEAGRISTKNGNDSESISGEGIQSISGEFSGAAGQESEIISGEYSRSTR